MAAGAALRLSPASARPPGDGCAVPPGIPVGRAPLYPWWAQDSGRWEAGPAGILLDLLSPLPTAPAPRSELIQLVAVTQKTAERSYREHIEQQIQTYQRRWGTPPQPPTCVPTTHVPSQSLGTLGPVRVASVIGNCCPMYPNPLLFNHICEGVGRPLPLSIPWCGGALCQPVEGSSAKGDGSMVDCQRCG